MSSLDCRGALIHAPHAMSRAVGLGPRSRGIATSAETVASAEWIIAAFQDKAPRRPETLLLTLRGPAFGQRSFEGPPFPAFSLSPPLATCAPLVTFKVYPSSSRPCGSCASLKYAGAMATGSRLGMRSCHGKCGRKQQAASSETQCGYRRRTIYLSGAAYLVSGIPSQHS